MQLPPALRRERLEPGGILVDLHADVGLEIGEHPGTNNHLERLLWCKITEVYYLGIDPGQSNSQISAYMVM